jgi:hypothetical protein
LLQKSEKRWRKRWLVSWKEQLPFFCSLVLEYISFLLIETYLIGITLQSPILCWILEDDSFNFNRIKLVLSSFYSSHQHILPIIEPCLLQKVEEIRKKSEVETPLAPLRSSKQLKLLVARQWLDSVFFNCPSFVK